MSAVATADEERALVDRFLADRDERAFREIYRQHGPALYGFARHLLERDAVVEDIVQEAWLRAVRRLPSFDGRSSLRAWLIGFVVNCCRESWRDARRHRSEQGPDNPREHAGPPAHSHAKKLYPQRALPP